MSTQVVRVSGPDDCHFLIEPYADGYTWRLHNDSLSRVSRIRPSVTAVQSFHTAKAAYREPESCNPQLPQIADLQSGRCSKPEIFVTFQKDYLRLGRAVGDGELHWPNGEDGAIQLWLIHVKITGLSRDWLFLVNLRWVPGTRAVELREEYRNQVDLKTREAKESVGKALLEEVKATERMARNAGSADSVIWRSIREDFESLPADDWSLIWSSHPEMGMFIRVQLPSQWNWFHPFDLGLRARASAVFLKAAKARGYDNEDQWLDELRYADFVEFRVSGEGRQTLPDGTIQETESGVLKDAVQHSITLCHQLEAGDVPKPLAMRFPDRRC